MSDAMTPGRRPAGERPPVLFCDFDGTITTTDNIVEIMQHYRPPGVEDIYRELVSGRKSIQQAVGEMFALLPSSMRDDIRRYVLGTARIRPGFSRLLEWCRENGAEFYVTSGGIDFFVHPLLAPFDIPEDRIFCNGSDFSGERIRITWPHPCDGDCDEGGCGMCKTTIMRRFPRDRFTRILIGDSITDFAGAKLADVVFSRARLTDQCRELGLPHIPFETFDDVVRALERRQR
jgi:2-hydroxy-3-keto-5-methylthiopentenyl-1-phosphate phosphatase